MEEVTLKKAPITAVLPIKEYLFNSSMGLKLSPPQVVEAILCFMTAEPKRAYKITIGTDSEATSDKRADFVTAIVVHRVGNGGRYFWRRIEDGKKFHTLRDRILQEVVISLEIAHAFLETTKAFEMPKFDFEIHVDIGENGATRAMISELTGMIRANNFAVKTKPDSYAASKVADRHGLKND
jgi:uncharacterized protein